MPKFIVIYLISLNCFAFNLISGDVLLQPLSCWSCNLIEAQEKSKYSHIGLYLNIAGKDMVLEAYGSVRLIELDNFLAKTEKGATVKVIRSKKYKNLSNEFIEDALSYVGNPYDSNFLWDNFSLYNREKIYCSELIYKAMKPYLEFNDLVPKIMLFDVNPNLWDKFFKNKTPRGKIGISPEDFNLSSDFFFVRYL